MNGCCNYWKTAAGLAGLRHVDPAGARCEGPGGMSSSSVGCWTMTRRGLCRKGAGERVRAAELPHSFLIDMLYGSDEQRKWAEKYLKNKYQPSELGVDFWKRVVDDKRHADETEPVDLALEAL